MRERLTTNKTKIFARENPTLMSITKAELRNLYNEVFDRLQEYEVAEEQGQIIVPPCKVGDTVWCIIEGFNQVMEGRVRRFTVFDNFINVYCGINGYFEQVYMDKDFGKTAFRTREEAEAALVNYESSKNEKGR